MPSTIKISDKELNKHIKAVISEEIDSESTELPGPVPGGVNLIIGKEEVTGKFVVIKDPFTDHPEIVYREP